MAKPSLMDGLISPDKEENQEGTDDKSAAFEELRKRFIEGDPEEAYDAFIGLMSLCDEDGEEPMGEPPMGKKPVLEIHIGHK